MRRTIIILVAAAALIAAGIFFWVQREQAASQSAFQILREAPAERGRITATVNATGSIEPEALVTLTFGLGGRISQVNAVRGQVVTAGDILAQVDTAELELAVQQTRDALRIQELTLQQRLNSAPTPATLASAQADIDATAASLSVAQANLASAEAGLQQAQAQRAQLLARTSIASIRQAEAQLAQAQTQQQQAKTVYDRTLQCYTVEVAPGQSEEVCPGLGPAEEQARFNLNQANLSLAAAEANLAELQGGPRPADVQAADAAIASARAGVLAAQGNIAVAEANVARARAAFARLQEPPSADEIAILEAQVAGGRTNLALAELRLRQGALQAPISGRVANVLINAGEQAAPGAPAITIVDEGAFHITVNVDEIDIEQIAIGQPVEIVVDALPNLPIQGSVIEIAPTSATTTGVVTYLVTINIDADETIPLRAGMSANASIVVDEIADVLIVPNWAVRLDRETGRAFVNVKKPDGAITEVTVETGLRNEQVSEVLSGLAAGDVVVVTNQREGLAGLFGN